MADRRRLRLQALGPVTASFSGEGSHAPVTQPRLISLLVYLAIARPRRHHSRDTLVALLWPEVDESSGRQGLRNALHRLRTIGASDVLITTGESFVELDPLLIDCDVLDFERAIDESRWEDALRSYGGELLQGFHVEGAPGFDEWLDAERLRLTSLASTAARTTAELRYTAGDVHGAIAAARRACALEPESERSFRLYLQLMVASGDRATAHRAYEDFAARLRREFGVAPALETQAALQASPEHRQAAIVNTEPVTPQAPTATATSGQEPGLTPAPRDKRLMRTLVGILLVIGAGAPAAFLYARGRPDTPIADDAIGATLPARWRTDTLLLGRYLRANALAADRRFAAARDSLSRLTRDAPLYAPAWALLARATWRSAFHDIPPRLALPRATAAARRALAGDSTLAVAHEALIAAALWGDWDLDSAKVLLDRALVMHPEDAELRNLLATWHRWRGEFDASLEIKRSNVELDPLSTLAVYQIAPSLYFAHRCEEAIAPYRQLPKEVRDVVGDHILYGSLMCAGHEAEAAEVLRQQALRDGDSALARSFTPGMTEPERRMVSDRVFQKRLQRELARRRDGWLPPERIMSIHARLKNADSTLVWLESMLAERSMMLYVVPFDPLMDFLRNDPRYDEFLRRLPWLSSLDDGPRRLIDSLRMRARLPPPAR